MLEKVMPVTGTIHSVGTSEIKATHTKWSTISVRQPDGKMQVLRSVETYDVVTPEIAPGVSGTFYLWGVHLVAIRHTDGEVTDAVAATVTGWRVQAYGMAILGIFVLVGVPALLALLLFGPRIESIQAAVMEHARSLEHAA